MISNVTLILSSMINLCNISKTKTAQTESCFPFLCVNYNTYKYVFVHIFVNSFTEIKLDRDI